VPALCRKRGEAAGTRPPNNRGFNAPPSSGHANPDPDQLFRAPVPVFQRFKQDIADSGQVVDVLMTVGEIGRSAPPGLEKRQLPVHLAPQVRPAKQAGLRTGHQGR